MSAFRRERAWLCFRRELREALRDRRSLMAMFGIPLVVYPLMILAIVGLMSDAGRKREAVSTRLVVLDRGGAEGLIGELTAESRAIELLTPSESQAEWEPGELLTEGRDAVLEVAPSESQPEQPRLTLWSDRSRPSSDLAEGRVGDAVAAWSQRRLEARLRELGAREELASPPEISMRDTSSRSDLAGRALGAMAPALLLISAALAAFYPAVGSLTVERENGLAEALLATPLSRAELLAGKMLLIALTALVGAALNLGSMSLVIARVGSLASEGQLGLTIDGGRIALAWVASIPAVLCLAACDMWVAAVARSYREAGHYATPVMLAASIPTFVIMAEPDTTLRLAATPMAGAAAVLRDVLRGSASWETVALSSVVHLACAVVLFRWAVLAYSPERWERPAWSPLSLANLRALVADRAGKAPDPIEALGLPLVSVLLLLLVAPSLLKGDFVIGAAVSIALCVGLPALLGALSRGRGAGRALGLAPPPLLALLGAVLVGLGGPAVAHLVVVGTSAVFRVPLTDFSGGMQELLVGALDRPIVALACLALVPAVCEELLFRGITLSGLRPRLGATRAVVVSAILFALAHLDMQAAPARAALGLLLGFAAVRSRSLWPAVVLHAVHNGASLYLAAWASGQGSSPLPVWAAAQSHDSVWILCGLALVAAGLAMIAKSGACRVGADPE